ncbi:MAG TPA: LysM peptidoglycan-binding domain-containing protein [Chloroflexia bacterium]|nr:LysM peptidoglycan-binding domain-containing protein [Chloroflexia bacterium]
MTAQCQINTLQDLITCFTNEIQSEGGQLTLSNELLPEAGILVSYLQLTNLVITGAKMPSSSGSVVVTGSATILNAPTTVTLTGWVDSGVVTLQLSGVVLSSAKWTFKTSFPSLPQYTGVNGIFLTQLDSFFYSLNVTVPTFIIANATNASHSTTQGITFTGTLDVTTAPMTVVAPLTQATTLHLSGTIKLGASAQATINLQAPIAGLSISLGKISISSVYVSLQALTDPMTSEYESVISLAGSVQIGTGTNPVIISSPLLQGDFVWALQADFAPGQFSLTSGLNELTSFINGSPSDFVAPPAILKFTDFYLSQVGVGMDPKTLNINYIAVQVSSNSTWNTPIPKMAITGISTGWLFLNPLDSATRSISGYVTGILQFGDTNPVDLSVSAAVPNFLVTAELEEGSISVRDTLTYLFGSAGNVPDLEITQLIISLDPTNQLYSFYAIVEDNDQWPINLGITTLQLESLTVDVNYSPTGLAGSISALLLIGGKRFVISAEHPGANQGWIFTGMLMPDPKNTISVTEAIAQLWGSSITLPSAIPDIEITALSATVNTGDSSFELSGQIEFDPNDPKHWQLKFTDDFVVTIDSFSFDIKSAVSAKTGQRENSGSLICKFKVNDVKMSVEFDFKPANDVLIIKMGTITATLTFGPNIDTVLTVNMGDMSFGDILTWLVNLARPGSHFSLDSPWDVLNSFSLKGLTLTINITQRTVGIVYEMKKDFGFIDIESIGLSYVKKDGKGTVEISFVGSFLGQQYGQANPLKWDALNDPPPSVPGKGSSLFDLKYLGVGQHLAFSDPGSLSSVSDVINKMIATVIPPADASKNPITQLQGLEFDAGSNWLLGTQFTVVDTLAMSVIFNDPVVYGLLIQLSGEKAKIFAGLSFEILYKKISDNLGMYHIVLVVPEIMRHLEFGEVSITLPRIIIDIYTNGNFKVDFGFPANGDFTYSFGIQAFIGPVPVLGAGGFYFALLSSATSTRVPKITNGNFNPVIEFGIGLQLGVGKTIDEGILKAGISVVIQGILQGALGIFNPSNPGTKSDPYYWLQGSVAIVGKLYGSIDFGIISASLDITISVGIQLTIEAYQPIVIYVYASVTVSLSVKIVFFTIHFSFHAKVSATFTIGSVGNPPWIVDTSGGQSLAAARPQLGLVRPDDLRSRPIRPAGFRGITEEFLAAATSFLAQSTGPDWSAFPIWTSTQTVPLTFTPSFTIGLPISDPNTDAPEAAVLGATAPQPMGVALLFIQNSIPQNANGPSDYGPLPPETPPSPFDQVIQAMLGWVIHAYAPPNAEEVTPAVLTAAFSPTITGMSVSLQQLENIYQQLSTLLDAGQSPFTSSNLADFFEQNITFNIAGRSTDPKALPVNATIFPMPPVLSLQTSDMSKPLDFSSYKESGLTYQQRVNVFLQQLMVAFEAEQNQGNQMQMEAVEDDQESLAAFIFQDYFAIAAKAAVQDAIDYLTTYSYTIAGGDSLSSIAQNFSTHGQGTVLTVGDIMHANQSTLGLFAANATLTLSGVRYSVVKGDTLQSIATKFTGGNYSQIVTLNQDLVGLLQKGAQFNITGLSYTVPAQSTLNSIATAFQVPVANVVIGNSTGNEPANLPDGTQLSVLNTRYTVVSGDTLATIAKSFSTTTELITALNSNLDLSGTLVAGTILKIPTVKYTVASGDTLGSLSYRFSVTPSSIETLNTGVDFSNLAPGTVLNMPDLSLVLPPSTDIGVAKYFGLTMDALVAANKGVNFSKTIPPNTALNVANTRYTVIAGDTPGSIASKFNTTTALLATLNPNVNFNQTLVAGTLLIIPLITYKTVAGDTADIITKRFALASETQFEALNPNVNFSNPLPTGTVLNMPDLIYTVPQDTSGGFPIADIAIAQFFNVTLQGLIDANKLVDFSNVLPASTALTIPTVAYTVGAADTLASIGYYYGISTATLSGQINTLPVLEPVATLLLPDFAYTIQSSDTFSSIASSNNLTVADLAEVEANQTNTKLLASGTALTLPNVPGIAVADLLNGLYLSGKTQNIAGMVSRFLLAGLRLPDPEDPALQKPIDQIDWAALNTYPLYYLTGQQFTITLPATTSYAINLELTTAASWISFADEAPDGSVTAVANDNGVPTLSLDLLQSEADFINAVATTPFTPQISTVGKKPLFNETPSQSTLQHSFLWQAGAAPPLWSGGGSAPANAQPTIWPFPPTLLQAVTNAESYGLFITPQTGTYTQPGVSTLEVTPVQIYSWSTEIALNLRQIPAADGSGPLPNTYSVMGTDDAGRALLEQLWIALNTGTPAVTPTLYLLYQPNAAGNNPNGLQSDVLTPAQVLLLKTNLSTLSHSSQEVMLMMQANVDLGAVDTVYSAALSDVPDFVKLLWECSVVNSGGYYLQYANATGGAGLPGYLFAQTGIANLTLLVTYAAVDATNNTVYPFQNSVVIGDNINTSNSILFTEAVTYQVLGDETLGTIAGGYGLTAGQVAQANSTDRDLLRVGATMKVAGANYTIAPYDTFASISASHNNIPVVQLGNDNSGTTGMLRIHALVDLNAGMVVKTASAPPGNVGMQLVRTDPTVGVAPNNEPVSVKLQVLYNLLGYEIAANTFFNQSAEGLPVGPANSDGTTPRALAAAPPAGTWNYERVVPVYSFSTTNDISGTGTVPPASGNPYAGIVSGAQVQIQLDFNDIFGNQMPATPPVNDLQIGVGYYDNIIGVSQWPAVAASYSFTGVSSSSANLNVMLHFDVSRYMPGPGQALATSVAKAQADLQTYTSIYYQIQQKDLNFTASTTVNQSAVESLSKAPIASFMNAVYAYLLAAQSLQAYEYSVQATDTLGGVVGSFDVALADLMSLNDDISSFFAAPLTVNVPIYHRIAFGDTLDSIATGASVSLANLVQNNQNVPGLLATGVAVTIGTQPYNATSTDTLSTILAQFTSSKAPIPTVASIGDLALANDTVTLAANVTFAYQGTTYETQGTSDSFNTVITHFPGASIPDIANANAQIALFNNNTPLTIPIIYAAKTGDTLTSIATAYKSTPLQIATANADSTTLLQQGAGLFLSTEQAAIQATDSLQVIAANASESTNYPLTTTEIAQQNLDHLLNTSMTTPLGAVGVLTIPDLVTITSGAPSTYQVKGPDTLAIIANNNGVPVTDLAEANKDLYGMLIPSKTVTVNSVSTPTTANDTLSTLVSKINAQLPTAKWISLSDLALAIKDQTPLLAVGAWILLPPPLLTVATPIALSAQTYPAQTIFEVTAQIGMARNAALIDPDFQDVPAVAAVSTLLAPNTYDPNNPDASLTLKSFATAFESAFAGLHLATAHENADSSGGSTTTPPKLWAVNLGSTGTQYTIAGATPFFFSVPPLSNTLLGEANVPLQEYKNGALVPADPRSFQSIDIDVWGQDFLAAIDSFLLPASAAPAYQLVPGEGQQGITGAQAYEIVLTAKQNLAQIIQSGVTNILSPTPPGGNLTAAQEALGQQLLITLSSAYTVEAIIQFDVNVTSPYSDAAAARFSGQPTADMVAPVVDYTLSSAQVPLTNGTSYLTFLFSTKSPASDKNVTFTGLTYQINEVEFDITPVPGIDGYVASSWLAFINPLSATPIPTGEQGLVVPVPLRAYPIPPTLVSQQAVYTPDPKVSDIETWEYDFTYQSLDADQDTVGTGVQYNVVPTGPAALAISGGDLDPQAPKNLFEALAQFSFAYPAVAADLALLPLVATQPGLAGRALSAVQAFASLVQVVPQFWQYPVSDAEEVYDHRYTIKKSVDENGMLSLTVRHAGGNSQETPPMPHLVVRGHDLVEAPSANHNGAGSEDGEPLVWTHKFVKTPGLLKVGAVQSSPTSQATVKFPGNNILKNQTAQGSVWVTRNSNLIPGATTNNAFVYQTPAVSFTNPLLPLLINNESYLVSEINADGTMSGQPQKRTLLQHLTALFSALFLNAPSAPIIKVLCRYSYQIVSAGGGATAIPISVPVFMLAHYTLQQSDLTPPNTCDCTNPTGFLCGITCAIQNWQATNQPAGSSGVYQFEIDIFSNIAPSATQPMLQITDLELSLGDILPPTT